MRILAASPCPSHTHTRRSQSWIPTEVSHSGHTRASALQPRPSARRSTNCRPKVWLRDTSSRHARGALIITCESQSTRPSGHPPYAVIEPKTGGSGALNNNRRWSRLCRDGWQLSDPPGARRHRLLTCEACHLRGIVSAFSGRAG